MQCRTFRLLWLTAALTLAAPCVLMGESIALTVDATGTQQKVLHVSETIPATPGAMTLYYPKWIPGEHGP